MIKQGYLPIGRVAKMTGVTVATLRRWDNTGKLKAVRLSSTGNRYYRDEDVRMLLTDPVEIANKWIKGVSPTPIDPNLHCRTRDIFQARLESLQNKLTELVGIEQASLITAITGEIGNNSFDHNLGNWPDELGIFFAYTLNRMEIVLADRGRGILATLGKVDKSLRTHEQAMTAAFTRQISGRPTEGRGNGLKFVKNVVTANPIKLYIQSGDASLELSAQKTRVKIVLKPESVRGCIAIINY